MGYHPLDDCDAAKRLTAMADAEVRRRAEKICEISPALATVIDQVFAEATTDLGFSEMTLDSANVECAFDEVSGTLLVDVSIVVPCVIDNIQLHLRVLSSENDFDDQD